MTNTEIKIDLTEIREQKSRKSVRELIESKGIHFTELNNFWTNFENDANEITENTIVFSDLFSLVKHIQNINHSNWAFKVKKRNPYFISFIRNSRDEKFADLIDDLVKISYNRLTVINAYRNFTKPTQKHELLEELNKIVSRNFNPDTLKNAVVNKKNNSFLIEFNNGLYGEITFRELQIDDIVNDLILDSLRINEMGNAVEIFSKDGDTFDIDSEVLKSFLSFESKNKIREQSIATAENVGTKLKETRKRSKITQKQLSEIIGIDQAIISKIETGKHLPRFDTLERISEGLETNVSDLLSINHQN